jgi:two-component system response regulator NreC
MKEIGVVLVDDHPLIREGLRNVINSQADMEVLGEAENGSQAIDVVGKLKPCVVVVDLALPDINGLEITTQIRDLSLRIGQDIHVVILSMFFKERLVYQALQAGAKGYISKSSPSPEIVAAIRNVCRGQYHLSSEVSTNVIPEYLKGRPEHLPPSGYDLLTEREQQIFRLLVEGKTNKDIADLLSISSKTVERHRANVMSKLEVHSYRELLKLAIDLDILDTEMINSGG